MNQNPYEAPLSAVGDPVAQPMAVGSFSAEPKACDVGQGVDWFKQGWASFSQSPGPWIGIAVVYALLNFAFQLMPLVGPLVQNLMTPVLIGGIMLGCHAQRAGEPFKFEYLFKGFERNAGQLFLIGAIYLGVLVLVLVAVGLLAFAGAMVGGNAFRGGEAWMIPVLIVLVALAVSLPLLMAVWFAPALVVINGFSAFEAMKLSFRAAWRNFVPFLVYGLVGLLLAIAATLPLLLGWFVLGPVVMASCYASYRDIFYTD